MKSSATTEYSRTRRERGCGHRVPRYEWPRPSAWGAARYSVGDSIRPSMGISRIDEAARCGPHYGLGSRRDIELAAGVLDMEIHCTLAQAQDGGNLGGSFPPCRPRQALQFSIVQRHLARPDLVARPPS